MLFVDQALFLGCGKLRQRQADGAERPDFQKIAAGDAVARVSRASIGEFEHELRVSVCERKINQRRELGRDSSAPSRDQT